MIHDYPTGADIDLPPMGNWGESVHRLSPDDAVALRAAEACGRPLLVRGAPGTGKSQMARAAAVASGRPLLSVVIDGRSEAQDLMWRFDAVGRLADAQRAKFAGDLKPEEHYVRPEALWWAFDWQGAATWLEKTGQNTPPPVEPPPAWQTGTGSTVLLIDEIDKADPDLPNALLDVLPNNGFRTPFQTGEVRCGPGQRPLIIITTNEERELPAAFLRRCLVLNLALPDTEAAFVSHLVEMGERHQRVRLKSEPDRVCHVFTEAARRLWEVRKQPGYQPGLAEYLDLVTALARLYDEAEQKARILELERLTYFKS